MGVYVGGGGGLGCRQEGKMRRVMGGGGQVFGTDNV